MISIDWQLSLIGFSAAPVLAIREFRGPSDGAEWLPAGPFLVLVRFLRPANSASRFADLQSFGPLQIGAPQLQRSASL